MTLERPMFPPSKAVAHSRARYVAATILEPPLGADKTPAKPKIGRRGLLGAFLALVPTAAAVGAGASLAIPAAPQRESQRLVWLGQQLDQAEAAFAAALERKARCRERAEMAYPEPPTEITWLPGQHPPAWCGVVEEADIDGKVLLWRADRSHFRSSARKIAHSVLLQDYIDSEPDKRSKAVREAKRMLPLARAYEARIEEATRDYRAASDQVYGLGRRIDRIAVLIYKCDCQTFEGVAIKALALMVATKVDVVDDYIAHRSKVLYATKLADDVLKLRSAA